MPEADQLGSTEPVQWKTYFHAYPAADGGVMIQYWHLFAYNALGVAGVGHHGGDWDGEIQVHLTPDLQRAEEVFYSRHANDHPGDSLAPSDVTWVEGSHPLVAIDGGGHAAYASPGDFGTHNSVAGGQIVWPEDMSDPLNPAKLALVACNGFHLCGSASDAGGVVWETWTGGMVTATRNLTHPITAPSPHGGMVNVGEYNPCTPTTCLDDRQASTLLEGQFHPLNDQIFLEYSGRWGSLGSEIPGAGVPPRGPVFQGWDDDHRVYTAWLNEGADAPVGPTTPAATWRRPPTISTSIDGPQLALDAKTYVSPQTRVSLAATETAAARPFGAVGVYYRVYAAGATPPPFQAYTGPIAPPEGDGDFVVEDYAIDPLGNQSDVEQHALTLDSQPPTTAETLAGPSVAVGGVTYVSPATTVTLAATLAGPLAGQPITTSYRVYPVGSTPPAFASYSGPFALPAPDGAYRVEFHSVDALGNAEPDCSLELTLDSVAPTTARALDGPTATSGGVTYVAGWTKVVLTASLASPLTPLGTQTQVRVYPAGSMPSAFGPYIGPFTLPAPDGAYEVDYDSVDALGNTEAQQSVLLTRDATAPTISIAEPNAAQYVHSATLTLSYGATDGGAGGVVLAPTIDGAATLAGHGLASGQAIPLLTELPLGPHTFALTATDAVGNTATASVPFDVVVTAASIQQDLPQLVATGGIAANRAQSLAATLAAAATAHDCTTAANVYHAFENEVRAQTGKSITAQAAAILDADADYLVAHCS